MSSRAIVEDLIYRTALLLDQRDFPGFLERCAPAFRYSVGAYSPEIRKQMTWLDHDRAGMQTLFETLPRHNSDPAPLTRHLTVYTVDLDASAGFPVTTASAVSALQVFRTVLDGGATQLLVVGKVHDTVTVTDGVARLARRDVRLQTRMLGIGSHIPF